MQLMLASRAQPPRSAPTLVQGQVSAASTNRDAQAHCPDAPWLLRERNTKVLPVEDMVMPWPSITPAYFASLCCCPASWHHCNPVLLLLHLLGHLFGVISSLHGTRPHNSSRTCHALCQLARGTAPGAAAGVQFL